MNNGWTAEFKPKAFKEFKKFDRKIQERVFNYIDFLINDCEHPRVVGKAMTGTLKKLWRYRTGDYRILCELQDNVMVILIVDVDHRKDVYDIH